MGRFSIYASWAPMLVAIVAGWWSAERRLMASRQSSALAAVFLLSTLVATGGEPAPLRAWAVWWVQAATLVAFVATLVRHVSRERFTMWLVVSLWPQALLAFFQAATNAVAGSKWIGAASQEATRSGVAVVDAGGRFLRAYGGFPHPNILGAWMAAGAIVALGGALLAHRRNDERWKLWALSSAAFSVAVAFSVSRAAWIGLCLGAAGWIAMQHRDVGWRRASMFAAVPLLSFGLAVISRPALLRSRATVQGRLEAKSVGERVDSYRTALKLWRAHPWIGVGINADVLRAVPDRPLPAPPQPVHALPLLWLAQLGILGCLLLASIGWNLARMLDVRVSLPLGLALLPSAFFDHFLWTLWAGQALVAAGWLYVAHPPLADLRLDPASGEGQDKSIAV
jgi:O-antigen ligase